MNRITLIIEEEYGYRTWKATLDKCEYDALLARWATMKNLCCLIPVTLIVPQAVPMYDDDPIYNVWESARQGCRRCHVHECDDSYLQGSDYVIPQSDDHYAPFEMDGALYPVWGEDSTWLEEYREREQQAHRE